MTYFILILAYLSLFTYSIPSWRIPISGGAFPFTAVLSVLMVVSLGFRMLTKRKAPSIPFALIMLFFVYNISILISLFYAVKVDWILVAKQVLFSASPMIIMAAKDGHKNNQHLVRILMINGVAIFLIGAYGYFSGEIGEVSEHLQGYFGVTYLESTRNSDMMFFHVPFLLILSYLFYWKTKGVKILYLAVTVAIMMGMVLSYSRGTWISIALGTLSLVLVNWGHIKSKLKILLFSIFGMLALVVFFFLNPDTYQYVADRFALLFTLSMDRGNSNQARIYLIQKSLELFAMRPLGVGIGNFRYYFSDFFVGPVNHAENMYLQVLVEQGIFGFLSIVGFLGWLLKKLVYLRKKTLPPSVLWQVNGAIAILITWIAYGMFNHFLDNMWFWMVISYCVTLVDSRQRFPQSVTNKQQAVVATQHQVVARSG